MLDPLRDLIRDTLAYMKDPLLPSQTIFASAKEDSFFCAYKGTPTTSLQNPEIPLLKQPSLESTAKSLVQDRQPYAIPKDLSVNSRSETTTPLSSKSDHSSATYPPKEKTLKEPSQPDHSNVKKILQKISPSLKLLDQIPDDAIAKKVANAWKEKISEAEVVLLMCDPKTETMEFLKGLAKAIDQHLAKAKILMADKFEKEKRWDLFLDKNSFRLVIASDGIKKLPELMKYYRENPSNAQFFLGKTPLLVLSSASIYKSIEHKTLLWKTVCQMLAK